MFNVERNEGVLFSPASAQNSFMLTAIANNNDRSVCDDLGEIAYNLEIVGLDVPLRMANYRGL